MLKVAVAPGHKVKLVSAVAEVLVLTVRLAQLVTLLQSPMTSTQYWPGSSELILVMVSELLVSPVSDSPSLVH